MRLLFVTPRFPYPPAKGDQVRCYPQIRELSRRHRVVLLSLAEAPVAADALRAMERLCARVEVLPLSRANRARGIARALASGRPLQVGAFTHPEARARLQALIAAEQIDLVHAVSIRAAECCLFPKLRPTVVDFIDCLSLNFARRSRLERGLLRWLCAWEAAQLRRYERRVCAAMDAGLVVSAVDAEALEHPGVRVVPNGVEVPAAVPRVETREPFSLAFTGNMNYFPNDDAARFLVREILPLIWQQVPQARAYLVGRNPSPALRRLADGKRVVVTGEVPRVEDYLRRCAVAVCPMRAGSGMQNKVLEAMANAAAVVATPFALGGLTVVPGEHLLVAESAAEFATAVLCLLGSPERRERLGQAGYRLVRDRCGWAAAVAQTEEVYAAALAANQSPAPAPGS
ncbi:MAG: glycosyltransferase [Armatimonadetes bacterium]|jgi:sugar transferase (PEP-CTERM/EpsH1 system associated)|nr:glycosyltransferase [Armatimonadota bacterium]